MKVLVCGGRKFNNKELLYNVLSDLHKNKKITKIINGNASGADSLARDWAIDNKVECVSYVANWTRYGKKAGILRNIDMLRMSTPDLIVAFKGGKGTEHMVKISRDKNKPILDYRSVEMLAKQSEI